MRRRPPPEVDPERLRSLLASARRKPEPVGPSGWVPEEAPHSDSSFDPAWLDEPSAEDEVDAAPGKVAAAEAGPGGRHRPPPRVVTVPLVLRGARVAVSVRAVVAFLLLLVVAVVFFAVRVARAEQAAAPQSVPAGEGLVGRSSVPAAFSSGTRSATASDTAGASARGSPDRLLVVDVVGQVARPGVVRVVDGSRVVDALTAAGGPLPGADVQRLNLARVVADGEQVFVPRPGETPPVPVGAAGGPAVGGGSGAAAGSASGAGAGSAGAGSGGASGAAAPLDLNAANLAALDTLPGVGPVLAQRILDWRVQHGRFSSVDELGEVSGIGDKLLEQIRPKVRV
jgi:competence protein ComEA